MASDILVVDDEADIRELVAGILEDEGHRCRLARASDEALRAVEERRPVLVATGRGRAVLLDRDGIAVAPGREDGLPVVELAVPPPDVGRGVVDDAALANAHRVWTGLSGPIRSRVVAMRAPDADGLELTLDDGIVVRFGRAELMEEKVRALGAVLDDVAGTEVTVVDVRVPGFPVVRVD